MPAYAIAHLRNVTLNRGLVDYLERIDATLVPFGGRFLIHGGAKKLCEGEVTDDIVVLAFPDMRLARAWYDSPDYQAIRPLRMQGAEGEIFLIEGVGDDHRATDILPKEKAGGV